MGDAQGCPSVARTRPCRLFVLTPLGGLPPLVFNTLRKHQAPPRGATSSPAGLRLDLTSGGCNSQGGSKGDPLWEGYAPAHGSINIAPEEADLQGYLGEHYPREGTVCPSAKVNSSTLPQKVNEKACSRDRLSMHAAVHREHHLEICFDWFFI